MKNNKNLVTFAVLFVLVLAGIGFLLYPYLKPAPTDLDAFASCLKAKGVIFYGAFWCPHCRDQKAMFGTAASLLPYNECSNPDETEMQSCVDKGVKGYPTWVFPDGSRLSGVQELKTLADKSGCALPAN